MNSNAGNDPKPVNPGPIGDPTSPENIPPKTPGGGADDDETGKEFPAEDDDATGGQGVPHEGLSSRKTKEAEDRS